MWIRNYCLGLMLLLSYNLYSFKTDVFEEAKTKGSVWRDHLVFPTIDELLRQRQVVQPEQARVELTNRREVPVVIVAFKQAMREAAEQYAQHAPLRPAFVTGLPEQQSF